jgi:hypothetical protein
MRALLCKESTRTLLDVRVLAYSVCGCAARISAIVARVARHTGNSASLNRELSPVDSNRFAANESSILASQENE